MLSGKEPRAEGTSNLLGWERLREAVRRFSDTPLHPSLGKSLPNSARREYVKSMDFHRINMGWAWSPNSAFYSHVILTSYLTTLGL